VTTARRVGALFAPVRSARAYLRASIEELRRTTWPTREQATQYTTIVVISVLVVTGITAALDLGLSKGIEQLITWSQRV